MNKVHAWLLLLLLQGFAPGLNPTDFHAIASEYQHDSALEATFSYAQALQRWKTPEDINAWIAANFSYDKDRSVLLSETRRKKRGLPAVYEPAELFTIKSGVCVDLSRFGVETLRNIDPLSHPRYLMIEFDPIQIGENTLRLHWLVSFKRDGRYYFFADSNRPGHIAGPYHDVQEFISEYSRYRGRKVVSFRERDSYRKERQTQNMHRKAKRNKTE